MDPEWIKNGGFLAVIAVLTGGLYYFRNKADELLKIKDNDIKEYQVHLDESRKEYITLLQDVLRTISANTTAIESVNKTLDISLKLEKITEGLRSVPK